jgi:hypothetical protein
MTPATKRRWFRFSLRTLFVVVTLLCCWLGYQLNWIRQRHAVLSRPGVYAEFEAIGSKKQHLAPLSLRLFAERVAMRCTFSSSSTTPACPSIAPT